MKSLHFIKKFLLCVVLSTVLVPQENRAMNFDSKHTWLLGGLVGGVATCLGLQYLWQKIRPQTPEQRLNLPKNAFIGYYIGHNVKIATPDFKSASIIFDATNQIAHRPANLPEEVARLSYACVDQKDDVFWMATISVKKAQTIKFDRTKNYAEMCSPGGKDRTVLRTCQTCPPNEFQLL
jgi:hypothetical protein